MAEGARMWAISLLSIMLLTLLSAAPIDIAVDIKKEDVKADNDGMHSHDEYVTRGGKFFGHNQFDIGNINVPGSVEGDDVSIGHKVNIDVHGHAHDYHHHEDDTVIECKEGLLEMFKSIDSNKNGLIDAMELLRVCHQNNIQITKPLAVRILTLPDKTVGFNIAKFCELLKDCPSTNIADSIYFLQQLFDKVAGIEGIEEDVPANIGEAGEFPTVLPEPPVPILPIVPIISGMSGQSADEHIIFEMDHLPAVCSSADPQFIPHLTDCSSYYQCAPGHAPVKYTCAAPTRWNAKINNCDYNVPCPSTIDGNWTPFSDWSVCSKTCGGELGQKVRTRTCTNPPPDFGGEDCFGKSEEVESCVEFENCPCIGTVSEWDCCSSTSPCKKNEGDCDRDSDCVGSLVCGTDNCRSINPLAHRKADCCIQPAIDGNWTPFSDWSVCSKTCGGELGQKVRTRTCIGGEDCFGKSEDVESCVEFKNCPVGTSAVGTCDSGTICGQGSLEPITDDIKKARKYACMLGDVEFIKPLNPNNPKNVKNAEAIVSEQKFEEIFPNRNAAYTYENFLKAIGKFPSICAMATTCKKILANMFGHFGQETAGLKYVEEIQKGRYCGSQSAWALEAYPCQPGKQYYGRGSKQLSHNYNYGAFSNAMFGTPMLLLNQPELVATTWLNFASGMWFFVTPQSPKPSILDVVEGRWQPNANDEARGLVNGFGTSIRIINGGQECGSGAPHPQKAVKRAEYYKEYASKLGLDISGEQLGCANMGKFSPEGSNGVQKLYWNTPSCNPVTWQSPYNALVEGDHARCLKISLDVTKVVPPECIPQAVKPVIKPQNWISSGPNKGRCGAKFKTPSGVDAECDPNSIDSCCSKYGWCGHTYDHCYCDGCKKFT